MNKVHSEQTKVQSQQVPASNLSKHKVVSLHHSIGLGMQLPFDMCLLQVQFDQAHTSQHACFGLGMQVDVHIMWQLHELQEDFEICLIKIIILLPLADFTCVKGNCTRMLTKLQMPSSSKSCCTTESSETKV